MKIRKKWNYKKWNYKKWNYKKWNYKKWNYKKWNYENLLKKKDINQTCLNKLLYKII